MGDDVLSIRTAQHCLNRFKNDNLEFDDLPWSGRPMELNVELTKQLIEEDPRLTDFMVFGRAAWMFSYCNGKTSERIRQDMEIWGLDTG